MPLIVGMKIFFEGWCLTSRHVTSVPKSEEQNASSCALGPKTGRIILPRSQKPMRHVEWLRLNMWCVFMRVISSWKLKHPIVSFPANSDRIGSRKKINPKNDVGNSSFLFCNGSILENYQSPIICLEVDSFTNQKDWAWYFTLASS